MGYNQATLAAMTPAELEEWHERQRAGGRKGGRSRSPAKLAAVRENIKKALYARYHKELVHGHGGISGSNEGGEVGEASSGKSGGSEGNQ